MGYKEYCNVIESQTELEPHQWTFKRHPKYMHILEHTSPRLGMEYLRIAQSKFASLFEANRDALISLCQLNDLYGNTHKHTFDGFTTCSPSNLRYILHSLLILDDMRKYGKTEVDVIEIGGGYGGLCLFLHKLSHLFGVRIKSYAIFDLGPPSVLQKRYLEAHGLPDVKTLQTSTFRGEDLAKGSFLISNYGFSELSEAIRAEYTEKVINPYTTHGFLAWNMATTYRFVSSARITAEEEYPQTHVHNRYVRFFPVE
jgi:hypothetical protein